MNKKSYDGINIQWPISQEIVRGRKKIETRSYPISEKYLNRELLLIETPGKSGKFKARATAIIVFTECFQYKNKKEFYSQENLHLVDKSSAWAWEAGDKWGWRVKVIKKISTPIVIKKAKGIIYTKNILIPSSKII